MDVLACSAGSPWWPAGALIAVGTDLGPDHQDPKGPREKRKLPQGKRVRELQGLPTTPQRERAWRPSLTVSLSLAFPLPDVSRLTYAYPFVSRGALSHSFPYLFPILALRIPSFRVTLQLTCGETVRNHPEVRSETSFGNSCRATSSRILSCQV